MKPSRADIQNAELQAGEAAAQVDTQVDDILRLRRTKQPIAIAEAALEEMVAIRDEALKRLKVMRRG